MADPVTTVVAYDDVIDVQGPARAVFDVHTTADGGPVEDLLVFSDGTILAVRFEMGVWRIWTCRDGSDLTVQVKRVSEPGPDDPTDSEVATLTGPVAWVAHATQYATARRSATGE